jgi:hypothetical protein
VDSETDLEVAVSEAEAISDVVVLMTDQEKCTKQSVLNADRNVKFLSNQLREDLYIAKNVLLKEIQEPNTLL